MSTDNSHGTPDVLDDGETARVVEGETTTHEHHEHHEHGKHEVLDDGETSEVVEGDEAH